MPRDNVTPFRPRKPAPKQQGPQSGGIYSHRGKAILVQALALAAFAAAYLFPSPPLSYASLILGMAGALIAFSNRGEAMPWANTHHEHVIRTIIIGAVLWTLSTLPLLFATSLPASVILGIVWAQRIILLWVAIRAGVGLVLAIMRRPVWHPKGVLL